MTNQSCITGVPCTTRRQELYYWRSPQHRVLYKAYRTVRRGWGLIGIMSFLSLIDFSKMITSVWTYWASSLPLGENVSVWRKYSYNTEPSFILASYHLCTMTMNPLTCHSYMGLSGFRILKKRNLRKETSSEYKIVDSGRNTEFLS